MLGVGEDRIGRAHGTGHSETIHLQNSQVLDTYYTLSQFTKDSTENCRLELIPMHQYRHLHCYKWIFSSTGCLQRRLGKDQEAGCRAMTWKEEHYDLTFHIYRASSNWKGTLYILITLYELIEDTERNMLGFRKLSKNRQGIDI